MLTGNETTGYKGADSGASTMHITGCGTAWLGPCACTALQAAPSPGKRAATVAEQARLLSRVPHDLERQAVLVDGVLKLHTPCHPMS